MFVVLPLESQWEGRDSARALEIACAKELWSPRKCTLTVFRLTDKSINPFAPGDFAEKRVLRLVEWFSGHCRAIKG